MQQVSELRDAVMVILGDEDNFVSDLELDTMSAQVIDTVLAELDSHDDNIAGMIDALDWETIYGIQTDIEGIQGTIVDQNSDLVSRMTVVETLLLGIPVEPNVVSVQIESEDHKEYYILTALNGQSTNADLTITVIGESKNQTITRCNPCLLACMSLSSRARRVKTRTRYWLRRRLR